MLTQYGANLRLFDQAFMNAISNRLDSVHVRFQRFFGHADASDGLGVAACGP